MFLSDRTLISASAAPHCISSSRSSVSSSSNNSGGSSSNNSGGSSSNNSGGSSSCSTSVLPPPFSENYVI